MQFKQFIPLKGNIVQVVVETPRGSQHKYVYDEELDLFRLKKSLPMGMVFPFDFGFIPNTFAEDGDPIDVLVLMDEPAYPGCMIECRLLGILMARQSEKKSKSIRNDRVIAVSCTSIMYRSIRKVEQLNQNMGTEIEFFFIDYNNHEGKKFTPIRFAGRQQAVKLIQKGIESFRKL